MPDRPWGWAVHRPDDDTGSNAGADTSDGGQDPGQTQSQGTGGDLSPDDLRDALSKARREAADNRAERRKLEERLQALEGEKLSDQEKLQKERDSTREENTGLKSRVQSLEVRLAVAELAGTIGILDAEAAVALLDTSKVRFGDDGAPDRKEIERELRDLAKRKPYLVRHGDAGGGAGGQDSQDGAVSMNDFIRRGAGRSIAG